MLKHKFKAIATEVDGIKFASKKEAKRYQELLLMKKYGSIVFFLRQVPFHLPGNVKYVCDFQIFWANGDITFEDVKGVKTKEYILKKKLVQSEYPIEIMET